MTDKHTPGPWHAWTDDDDAAPSEVRDENAKAVAVCSRFAHAADARLIAAAPDLLEALRSTLELAEKWADGVG